MKAILYFPLFFAPYASADEGADRAAIDRTIAALNEVPRRTTLFTGDSDAPAELERLWKAKPMRVRILGPPGDSVSLPRADRPTVTISHEPWGEATINFGGMESLPAMEILNPRIVSRTIRFITPGVALADGTCTYGDGSATPQTTPLLFVMKKEADTWKIAALRVLAPR